MASKNGYLYVIKYLIENEANINALHDGALRLVCMEGDLNMVKFLMIKGANLHASDDYALRWAS